VNSIRAVRALGERGVDALSELSRAEHNQRNGGQVITEMDSRFRISCRTTYCLYHKMPDTSGSMMDFINYERNVSAKIARSMLQLYSIVDQ
jgi:hypothetical protein